MLEMQIQPTCDERRDATSGRQSSVETFRQLWFLSIGANQAKPMSGESWSVAEEYEVMQRLEDVLRRRVAVIFFYNLIDEITENWPIVPYQRYRSDEKYCAEDSKPVEQKQQTS